MKKQEWIVKDIVEESLLYEQIKEIVNQKIAFIILELEKSNNGNYF